MLLGLKVRTPATQPTCPLDSYRSKTLSRDVPKHGQKHNAGMDTASISPLSQRTQGIDFLRINIFKQTNKGYEPPLICIMDAHPQRVSQSLVF